MPTSNTMKIETKRKNLFLRVSKGHFATSNSHSNYYIDVTAQKARLSEARAVAEELCNYYRSNTIVDTILCLDGMEVVGACLASRLTEANYANMNAHQTIYVVTPEITGSSQLMFRDNIVPMIDGKHVLILAVSVATGRTVEAAVDAVKYYGGQAAGICSFSIQFFFKECVYLFPHLLLEKRHICVIGSVYFKQRNVTSRFF